MPSKSTCLALLALIFTSVGAVDVKFRRFSQPKCNEDFHITKDTHLQSSKCKTFDSHESPFESFVVIPEGTFSDMDNKYCEVTAFENPKCEGPGFTMGNLKNSQGVCGNVTMTKGARSALVFCKEPNKPKSSSSGFKTSKKPKTKASTTKKPKPTKPAKTTGPIVTSTPTKSVITMVVTVPHVVWQAVTSGVAVETVIPVAEGKPYVSSLLASYAGDESDQAA